jgi:cytosine/adenosine deaminase-related metal-dependent hydrolase
MDAGVNVAITTDGTSPATSFDLFQAMRKTRLIQQLATRDAFLLPPGKLLEMVTIDAARAIGWEDEIGSIERGKHADLVIIDLRQPHLTPNYMIAHRLVHEAVGSDVESVMVAGKWVLRERRALAVDETSILDRANRESRAVIERAGLGPFLHDPGWGQVRRRFEDEIPLPQ